MIRARINILGIAICYYDSAADVHKVLFPFNDEHIVRFKIDGEIERPLAEEGRQVVINATPQDNSSQLDVGNFIDITGNGAHSGGVEVLSDWPERGLLLTINNASFRKDADTKCRYGLHEANGTPSSFGIIGYSGHYQVEGEMGIEIDISGSKVPIYGNRIPLQTGSTVTFDNTCRSNCTGNATNDQDADFKMIYSVVSDKDDPGRYLHLDRHPSEKPQTTKDFEMGVKNNNPELRQPGLPCNILVASDEKGLP